MFPKPMNPRTVEDVIMDFKGRRASIIKALTKDVEEFYQGCDPSYPNLCLYGYPNRRWEVNLPPPGSDLPEPRLGINFSRDVMKREDWLSMVALHSESWLHGMASYFGAKFNFDKFERKRLFSKIAEFPSICEVLSGGPARRKRVRFENCGLPEEMLIEVLTRVPVKDLIRYRSVSKRWRSIIDDSGFVGKHLSSYKSNLEGSHLLVMEVPRSYFKDVRVLVRSSDMFRKATTVDRLEVGKNSSFLSYINGVMLVRSGYHLLLWNPSINRSLNLPDSILQFTRDAAYYELGLGFDASNNDYKVIAIVYPQAEMKHVHCGNKRFRATVPGLVQVYTLSTKAWTGLIDLEPPTYWSSGSQAFINGAIHWTSLGPNTRDDSWHTMRDSHIVSFDVTNEVFRYFELPSGLKDCDHDQTVVLKENKLLVMDGSLAMFRSYESHNDIWVMKEYGVPESWSKLYTFALKMDWNNLVYLKSNGELLYAMEGKGVLAYDIKKKRVRDVAKTYNKTSKYIVYTYVQSLVLSSISKPPEIIGAGGQNHSVFTTI